MLAIAAMAVIVAVIVTGLGTREFGENCLYAAKVLFSLWTVGIRRRLKVKAKNYRFWDYLPGT